MYIIPYKHIRVRNEDRTAAELRAAQRRRRKTAMNSSVIFTSVIEFHYCCDSNLSCGALDLRALTTAAFPWFLAAALAFLLPFSRDASQNNTFEHCRY